MCTACDWAPHFARYGSARATRRTVLTVAAVAAATTAMTACSPTRQSASPSGEPSGAPSADKPADFVFRNGPIYTVTGADPWATGLAVTGNTITHVGDEAGAMAQVGEGTRVVAWI